MAARLGRVDVAGMLDELSLADWFGWLRFYDAEPWGPERDDMRFEVMRSRLLGSFSGCEEHQLPDWQYPHKLGGAAEGADDAELIELAEKRRKELAGDG